MHEEKNYSQALYWGMDTSAEGLRKMDSEEVSVNSILLMAKNYCFRLYDLSASQKITDDNLKKEDLIILMEADKVKELIEKPNARYILGVLSIDNSADGPRQTITLIPADENKNAIPLNVGQGVIRGLERFPSDPSNSIYDLIQGGAADVEQRVNNYCDNRNIK